MVQLRRRFSQTRRASDRSSPIWSPTLICRALGDGLDDVALNAGDRPCVADGSGALRDDGADGIGAAQGEGHGAAVVGLFIQEQVSATQSGVAGGEPAHQWRPRVACGQVVKERLRIYRERVGEEEPGTCASRRDTGEPVPILG